MRSRRNETPPGVILPLARGIRSRQTRKILQGVEHASELCQRTTPRKTRVGKCPTGFPYWRLLL